MPIHDWTRVTAGTWHAFHLSWISELQLTLNGGLRPETYYAQAEQIAGPMGPDVLTLQSPEKGAVIELTDTDGGVAVLSAPPRVRLVEETELDDYARKRRTLVIRHASGDRIVALLELVSPCNMSSSAALDTFVEKAVESLARGYHLLIVDLFPPGPRDPQGIYGAIRLEFGPSSFALPADEPLTLLAFSAGHPKRAYVEPTAVGRELIPMPPFLEPERYINVPLEQTYNAAYRGVPQRWKRVLEADR